MTRERKTSHNDLAPDERQSASGSAIAGRDIRSFGRRRGRTLSRRQSELMEQALPRFGLDLEVPPPDKLVQLFDAPVTSVWLEIGFGAAEHLVWQAQTNRDAGIIGCEPYVDGVVKALTAIEDFELANVRIHDDDVREVLRWLKPGSLNRVFILFPDPWPKSRHRKRRLVNQQMFELLGAAMAPGAQLLIATDIPDYARTMMIAAQTAGDTFEWTATGPSDWRSRPGDWPRTRYEQKAEREGRQAYFFTFERRAVD